MALSYDQLSAITQKKFIPKLVDNIFDSDFLLQRAKKKGWYEKLSGGTQILAPLAYAQTTAAGTYQGADTLSTTDNDQFTSAAYDWKQYYGNITISRRDELMNSGDSQIVNFVKQKTMMAEKTLIDLLGTGLYSAGTDTKALSGLRVILSTSNTVGGISQSTYSWWQPTIDSSTTTLTMSALQSLDTTLTINNESPTIYMATRTNYNRYYALLQPQQRFTDSETAKGGFTNLMFNGKPFIAGSKVPSGYVIALNEAYIHLWVHQDEDMRFEPFIKPTNQNVKTAKVYWMGELGSDNNRMHGALSAIAA
jgi:hypothetical protein